MQGPFVGSVCRVPTQNQALSPVKCLLQYASHCTTGQRANAGNRTRKMHEDPAQRLVVSDFMQGHSDSAKAATSVVQKGGWGGRRQSWGSDSEILGQRSAEEIGTPLPSSPPFDRYQPSDPLSSSSEVQKIETFVRCKMESKRCGG